MNVALVFNNSRGFSQRHWNDLTYRNIFRFTFMEPFVVGILLGTEALHKFHQLSIPPVCTQTLFRHPTFFFTHQTPLLWLHCLNNKLSFCESLIIIYVYVFSTALNVYLDLYQYLYDTICKYIHTYIYIYIYIQTTPA